MGRKIERCMLNCGRPVAYNRIKLCKTCYARLYAQAKKGPTWMVKRLRNLHVWEGGLEELLGGKVTSMERSKKKRKAV